MIVKNEKKEENLNPILYSDGFIFKILKLRNFDSKEAGEGYINIKVALVENKDFLIDQNGNKCHYAKLEKVDINK